MEGRDLLTHLAIKYNGDFELMYGAINEREKFTDKEINESLEKVKKKGYKVLTILDSDYPEKLKKVYKPPLVLFIKKGKVPNIDNSVFILNKSEYGKDIITAIEKNNTTIYFDNNDIKCNDFVATEYFLKSKDINKSFRIASGLADKVVICKCDKNDRDTQLAVMFALQQGKDIFALPHSLEDKNDYCNSFIRDGALALIDSTLK